MTTVMGCGHTANALNVDGNPVCVICFGSDPGAETIAVNLPDLSNRFAKCMCGTIVPSEFTLAFFEYLGPDSNKSHTACKMCGFYEVAHAGPNVGSWVRKPITHPFVEHGPYEYDGYYCGCRGWD
jgi:hypothetical protein